MTDHNNPPAPVAGDAGADDGPVAIVFLKDNGQYEIMWLRPVPFVDGKAALFVGGSDHTVAASAETGYVECRQCDRCNHTGINDSPGEKAACHNCDWTGDAPEQDKCPGCGEENCMAAACPKCGGVYRLIAESRISSPLLDKPAMVGGGRFGVGVKWSTVIGAAQRLYEYEVTPSKEAVRIKRATESLNQFRRNIGLVLPEHMDWDYLRNIAGLSVVDESLRNFAQDPTEDNAVCLVRDVIEAAATQEAPQ